MKAAKGKTVRFAALVKRSGSPELFTAWTDPEKDPAFKPAISQKRILTVKQMNVGTKKDYGRIGFFREPNASFLIFPKALGEPEGTKVVGIKYELVASPPPRDPVRTQPERRRARKKPLTVREPKPARLEPPKPKTHRFAVTVRCIAEVNTGVEVEVRNRKEARAKALDAVAEREIDFSLGKVQKRVVDVKQV